MQFNHYMKTHLNKRMGEDRTRRLGQNKKSIYSFLLHKPKQNSKQKAYRSSLQNNFTHNHTEKWHQLFNLVYQTSSWLHGAHVQSIPTYLNPASYYYIPLYSSMTHKIHNIAQAQSHRQSQGAAPFCRIPRQGIGSSHSGQPTGVDQSDSNMPISGGSTPGRKTKRKTKNRKTTAPPNLARNTTLTEIITVLLTVTFYLGSSAVHVKTVQLQQHNKLSPTCLDEWANYRCAWTFGVILWTSAGCWIRTVRLKIRIRKVRTITHLCLCHLPSLLLWTRNRTLTTLLIKEVVFITAKKPNITDKNNYEPRISILYSGWPFIQTPASFSILKGHYFRLIKRNYGYPNRICYSVFPLDT